MDPDERDTGRNEAGVGAESGAESVIEPGGDAWAEVTDAVPGAAKAAGDGAPVSKDTAAQDAGAQDTVAQDARATDGPAAEEGAADGAADSGPGRGDPWARLGEEARRLAESLTGQESDGGGTASSARLADEARRLAESLVGQAEAVREQVARRHPEVAAHLAAAGTELASAYRAFVGDRERRWAARPAESERIRLDDE